MLQADRYGQGIGEGYISDQCPIKGSTRISCSITKLAGVCLFGSLAPMQDKHLIPAQVLEHLQALHLIIAVMNILLSSVLKLLRG